MWRAASFPVPIFRALCAGVEKVGPGTRCLCMRQIYDGVWNASHALSIVGPGLPGVEKREKSTAFSRSEVIVHRKQAFTIARRQTDLDCPLTIVMIEDRCSSILQSPRKTREKDKREAMALEKLASLSLLHLHEYLPRPLIFENVLIVSQCPRIPGYFCTYADSVYTRPYYFLHCAKRVHLPTREK